MIDIKILKDTNEIQVCNVDTNHYIVYGYGQKEKFLAEVEGAENYVNEIDWTVAPVIDEGLAL